MLRTNLVKCDLIHDAKTQIMKNKTDALVDVFTGLRAHLFDLFLGLCSLILLSIRELSNSFDIPSAAQIDELATPLHVQH